MFKSTKFSSKGNLNVTKKQNTDDTFTKNIFDILKIRLALENIKFTDSEILHEIKEKLNNVNKRKIDIKFVNETIERLFSAMKESYNKRDKKVIKKEIKQMNKNADRTRAMSMEISQRKWLDSYLNRPKVRNLRPLKFNEYEKENKRKLSFFEENELSYSIYKKNPNNEYDLEKIQNKIINEITEKNK